MAKGDRSMVTNAIGQQGTQAGTQLGNLQGTLGNQYGQMGTNYNVGTASNLGNYGNIMNAYSNFLNGGAMGPGGSYSAATPPIISNPGMGVSPYRQGPSPSFGNQMGTTAALQAGTGGGGLMGLGGVGGSPYQSQLVQGQGGMTTGQGMQENQGLSGNTGVTGGGITNQQQALQAALGQGLTGQSAVDWVQQNYPQFNQYGSGIEWQPSTGTYGMQGGYFAQNPQSGQWGLVPRGGDSSSSGGSSSGGYPGAVNQAIGGYGNFAQTGGFTPQQISDLRARMIAPIRGVYSQAQDELQRQKELSGGYSPNANAASAQMARQQANTLSDATTNANAQIAQMVQQGQLAGLGGLSQTGLLGQGQNLAALQGMTGLYGAAPGLANTFGNQMLGTSNQMLGAQGLNNQLNLGLIGDYMGATQVPSDWQQMLGTYGPMIAGGLGGIF